jgi:hypothetical protein
MSFELPKNLLENLEPGEAVLDTLKTTTLASKPDWTILTDRRIIYFNEKHLGRYDMVVIPYPTLQQMRAEKGVAFFGSIVFVKEDGVEIHLERVPKDIVESFENSLERALNNVAVEPISITRNRKLLGRMKWEFDKPAEMLFRMRPDAQQQMMGYAQPQQQLPQDPIEALNLRFARGEITEEQYQRMRQILGQR